MNIEQLEKGKELRKTIECLNDTQTKLITNYKRYSEQSKTFDLVASSKNKPDGIIISFSYENGDSRSFAQVPLTHLEKLEVFNLVNNALMKKITALETEFSEL